MGASIAEAFFKGVAAGITSKAIEKLTERAPVIKVLFRGRKRPIILLFALVADFYEVLDYDVVHGHLSSLLCKFRKVGDKLFFNDIEFKFELDLDYAEGYELVGMWLDDITGQIDPPEIDNIPTPVCGLSLYLHPLSRNVKLHYIVYAAYALLHSISNALLDTLDLRVHRISRFACVATEDEALARKIYEKILSNIRKKAVTIYHDFYQRPDKRFAVILSLTDALARDILIDALPRR